MPQALKSTGIDLQLTQLVAREHNPGLQSSDGNFETNAPSKFGYFLPDFSSELPKM